MTNIPLQIPRNRNQYKCSKIEYKQKLLSNPSHPRIRSVPSYNKAYPHHQSNLEWVLDIGTQSKI